MNSRPGRLLLFAVFVGCAKKTPPTTHIEFSDPDIIRLFLNRPVEDIETEPAPGDELTTDAPPPEARASVPNVLFASPPQPVLEWSCFIGKILRADGTLFAEVGECWAFPDTCEERRRGWRGEGVSVGPSCGTQIRAACLYYEHPLTEAAGYACFQSFAACHNVREFYAASPEFQNIGPCDARRVTQARK